MIYQQDYFTKFNFYDAVELGLFSCITGYYVLFFFYFFLMRYRTSKRFYWLCFSFLFLALAVARIFFILYYFFVPELENQISLMELINLLMFTYRMATFFTWISISFIMGVLGVLLFPPNKELIEIPTEVDSLKTKIIYFFLQDKVKLTLRVILMGVPLVMAILALTLPDELFMDPDIATTYNLSIQLKTIFGYPYGRFIYNIIMLPLMVFLIPIIFLYLAFKTFGILRRSYALNALGFFLYFAGRASTGIFDALMWYNAKAIIPPLFIILALLVFVIGNVSESLK
ncbi:MAG: hypothetical protein ACTSUN_03990 [Promethearchaeota archaeon]